MSDESPAILERLLRNNELEWMIDMYVQPSQAVPHLLEQLESVANEYRNRIGVDVPFTPEALTAEAERNPHKVRAFLQALSASHSSSMLVMVWRILQGLSIREVTMSYRELEAFRLDVILARPGQENGLETYHSENISDAALLRHFGLTTVDRRPLFEGFFPGRKK